MSDSFTLVDAPSLDDLRVYLGRAARVEEGSVRLIGGSGVLAVYVAVLYPIGLLDESPTVLGLRTVALAPDTGSFDVVVPVRSLIPRVERAQEEGTTTVALPMGVNTVTWTAISPPRGGWHPIPGISSDRLDAAARAGIEEVAAVLPEGAGEQIVRRIRSEIWGRPIEGWEHVPAGAGFAALSLGFLGDDEVRLYETGPWTRLTTSRGHVLVRRRAWTLSR
jgi:hypothetical protein